MRRIVHLSDIHFGKVDDAIAERVIESVNEMQPHVVVVSGDLTQRAKSDEFRMARHFLDRLPSPQIVVPGNHDVPLYNVYDRFARPLEKFRQYITEDRLPTHIDDEIAIIGINTARSLTIKSGRINEEQIGHIRERLCDLADDVLKVIVTHHPFDLPEGHNTADIVRRAMPRLAECGADVFLAGHLHISHIVDTAKRYKLEDGRSALVVQAGTATSVRGRGEAQSFNVIVYEHPTLTINRMEWSLSASGFQQADTSAFRQSAKGWERVVDK